MKLKHVQNKVTMNKNKNKTQKKKPNQCNDQNENENQNTSFEICNNKDHDKMIECSECKTWIHYECTDLPPYTICSLTKGRGKYLCHPKIV